MDIKFEKGGLYWLAWGMALLYLFFGPYEKGGGE